MESLLSQAVLAETNDATLESYISRIEEAGNLKSKAIAYRDFQTIRESIRIGHIKTNQGPKLSIALEGNGGEDERQLVDMLSRKVFTNLQREGNDPIAMQSRVERLKQAEWIIDQMEEDLSFVRNSLNQEQDGQLNLDGSSNSSFHLASNKKVVQPTVDELQNSIDSIDIQNLRSVIEGLKSEAGQLITPQAGAEGLGLQNLKPSETLPINGVPSTSWLILIGMFATAIGSVVAMNIKPFASRGFEDTQSIREILDVPVVATLNLEADDGEAEPAEVPVVSDGTFANRVASIAGMFLFGVVVVIAGFILLNTDVREAFLANPFFGCAKIVRMFVGY